MASFVRRIARLRFETPLAAALGVAGGFAAWEAPLDGLLPVAGRGLIAAVALVALPPVAWFAMRPRRVRPAPVPEAAVDEPVDEEPIPVVRMRRADRHPDAPVPQPIRASRDLGTPFMAVADEPAHEPETARFEEIAAEPPTGDEPAAIEIETLELHVLAPEPLEPETIAPEAAVPEPVMPEAVMPEIVMPEVVTPEAVEPEIVELEAIASEAVAPDPADADEEPAIVRNDSLAAMMERLSRGVERRGGVPPRRSAEAIARPVQPALRDALATLNRLADRR